MLLTDRLEARVLLTELFLYLYIKIKNDIRNISYYIESLEVILANNKFEHNKLLSKGE